MAIIARAKVYVNVSGTTRAVARWKHTQLMRIGAYARGIMRKQIRPPLKGRGKQEKTVLITPERHELSAKWKGPLREISCLVRDDGVTDVRTGRPVPKAVAKRARQELRYRLRGKGEGKPPRRGPTDKLRQGIVFAVRKDNSGVVVGARPFPKQPPMTGRVSVPQLLDKGGIEIIQKGITAGKTARYGPRPYVQTIMQAAKRQFFSNIQKHPIRRGT